MISPLTLFVPPHRAASVLRLGIPTILPYAASAELPSTQQLHSQAVLLRCATRMACDVYPGANVYTRVVSVNAEENKLTVLRNSGQQTTYDPRRQMSSAVGSV
jgi:hypothetical protein